MVTAEMDRTCCNCANSRNAYRILEEKLEGKRPLRRPTHRWEWDDNIKMNVMEVGGDAGDLIAPAQDRDQWRVYVRG